MKKNEKKSMKSNDVVDLIMEDNKDSAGTIQQPMDAVFAAIKEVGDLTCVPELLRLATFFCVKDKISYSTVVKTRMKWRQENESENDCRKLESQFRRSMARDDKELQLLGHEIMFMIKNSEILDSIFSKSHSVDQLIEWKNLNNAIIELRRTPSQKKAA